MCLTGSKPQLIPLLRKTYINLPFLCISVRLGYKELFFQSMEDQILVLYKEAVALAVTDKVVDSTEMFSVPLGMTVCTFYLENFKQKRS